MTHSPTPWRLKHRHAPIFDAEGDAVFIIDSSNAEFIVTAVNAYEANQAMIRQLVEALKSCIDYGSMTGGDWVSEKAHDALEAARKAGF